MSDPTDTIHTRFNELEGALAVDETRRQDWQTGVSLLCCAILTGQGATIYLLYRIARHFEIPLW